MNDLIDNITIKIEEGVAHISISTSGKESRTDEIEAKILDNNTFRFTYLHPATNSKEPYTGYLEKKKVWLYPQYGETYLTNNYISPIIL